MKKLSVFIALAASFAAASGAHAYSELDGLPIRSAKGFYTVITDTQNITHKYDGILETAGLEDYSDLLKIASYEIFCGDSPIIEVNLTDITPKGSASLNAAMPNGYYSVRFDISKEDNTAAFLTGLSDSNLNKVQEHLISAKLENSQFTMESLDFIDAEKTNIPNDGDNELCWAAASANILHYTGWGAVGGFLTPDDILDDFRDSFTDVPSNQVYGMEWFFDGSYTAQDFDGWAKVKEYGKSGAYVKDYEYSGLCKYISVNNKRENMQSVMNDLENGWGVGIVLSWLDSEGNRMGGHAISAWGYVYDKDFSENDPDYYKALVVSDSDSDMQSDDNRRIAPNKLCVLNMTPYDTAIHSTWKFDGYGPCGTLEDFVELMPYDSSIAKETDESAKRNKALYPDLIISSVYASNDGQDRTKSTAIFGKGDSVYITPLFENTASKAFDGNLNWSITVTNLQDSTSYTQEVPDYCSIDGYRSVRMYPTSDLEPVVFDNLAPGTYQVYIELNSDHATEEAYYYNNTYTCNFTVLDTSYNANDIKLTADLGEIVHGTTEALLNYENLDSLNILKEIYPVYTLCMSYYENGKWSKWEEAPNESSVGSVSLMSDEPPQTAQIYARGTKVKFRLVIEAEDGNIPLINIYSDEIALNYEKLSITSSQKTYTALESGAKELASGESFDFSVTNASTYDSGQNIECDAVVYAKLGNEKIELYREKDISLGYGESTKVSVNSWDELLSGSYEIVVATENGYMSEEKILGTLNVAEAPSLTVTTEGSSTPYDNLISLEEAIEYAGGSGEITFAEDVKIIVLNKTITIDGDIKISGKRTAIVGNGSIGLFKVNEGASLEISNMALGYGSVNENGGAICSQGGSVKLDGCILNYNKSGRAGGAVYSKGGGVTLKNCFFRGNISGYGGAVAVDGGAVLDMLNCVAVQNTSNGGALYNNNSKANIIYSTFTNNTAKYEGGGAVTSLGETEFIGSIAVLSNDGKADLYGNINVYGSYITAAEGDVTADENTVYDSGKKLFACVREDRVQWIPYDMEEKTTYMANITPLINEGIYVKNENGYTAYSKDKEIWNLTKAQSAFADEEYNIDLNGDERAGAIGAIAKTCNDVMITEVYDNTAYIYVPEAMNGELIEKRSSIDMELIGVKIYEAGLDTGTTAIEIDPAQNADITTYMLWDSIWQMYPLCGSYRE